MPSAMNFPKLIFSFTLNRKTDRYSYYYYPSVSAQALEAEATNESKSSTFKSVLDDFVNEVTTASNMYLFLYELNNGYRRHIVGSKLIPAVQEKGKKIDAVENYEESYELDARFSADHKFLFSQVAQSNRTRDALGPMILLNITARYDVLISGLLRIYFQTYPGLLDKSEKNFSLTELKRIGSIEEAEK
ncbi:hypothetical protein [Methylobacterium phyllostachyos]|uniref:hypothetical protein n=1 Tax=Methylobacterium phyllostachyos TaxID=582672 RepID=UPI00115F9B8A|nr:hypothetical protein [Methylobacterium phyllostachyos]